MLDQPVPNPIAKNPNIHTHKVFASVGLILIGTIIAVAGIWWYVDGRNTDSSDTDTNVSTTKVSTSSANNATTSAKKDEVKLTNTYTDNFFKVSYMYPTNWDEKAKSDISACQPAVGLKNSSTSGFSICQFTQNTAEQEASIPASQYVSLKTTTSINGKTVIRQVVTENGSSIVYLYYDGIKLNGQTGSLTIQGWINGSGKTNEEFAKQVDDIAATFKFL